MTRIQTETDHVSEQILYVTGCAGGKRETWVQRVMVSFADKQRHCWAKTDRFWFSEEPAREQFLTELFF